MKKQRIFWMDDKDWKRLQEKVSEYFEGKGKLERFMEKVAREKVVFIQGEGRIVIKIE